MLVRVWWSVYQRAASQFVGAASARKVHCAIERLVYLRIDPEGVDRLTEALIWLGTTISPIRDGVRAIGVIEESIALARATGDDQTFAMALTWLGMVRLTTGTIGRSRSCARRTWR